MAVAKKLLYLLLLLLLCLLLPHAMVSLGNNSNSTDELALLSFKSMLLSSGPSSLVASWNTSSHFCSWPGVVCGRRHPGRVVALRMASSNLSGSISPFLGNLSFLRALDLRCNQLVGEVPPELGYLRKLRVLNLSTNHLEGSIPVTFGGCTRLKKLDLYSNQLQGHIPHEVGTLKNLVFLDLGKNELSGGLPASLGDLKAIRYLSLYKNRLFGEMPHFWDNLTNLQILDLAANMLSGAIPSSVGMLSSLSWLDIGRNNLTGLIPISLWNVSSLTVLSVQNNMLSGIIPPDAFDNVPRLQTILMDRNRFHGPIPSSISNASDMMRLQLDENFLSGVIPPEVGSLIHLTWLQLSDTLLQAKEPNDWEFLTNLQNCSGLQSLALADNKFEGVIPDSLSNLSAALTTLFLEGNRISGSIPKDIGNLHNMQMLILNNNFFIGSLPTSLCQLQNLVAFYGNDNNMTGSIPLAIGNLTGLSYLRLYSNAFSSTIPETLGNLTKLTELDLSSNYLTGTIPSTVFDITTLSRFLDLSHNNLVGTLPQEIGNLKNLIEFDAGSNSLSGDIPTTIGECQVLQYLSLENNTLNGSIPLPLSQLKGLEGLDLSSNNFSGQIPKSLGNLTALYYLNLSFNNFAGEVPNFGIFTNVTAVSVQGNNKLCGGVPDLHLPTCSSLLPKRKHKFLVIPIVISLVTTLVILPLLYKLLCFHKTKTKILSTQSVQGHPIISYLELVRATNSFSMANLLGSGSFGSVYKGELNGPEGAGTTLVAVKVLKLHNPKALKSFIAECEALRTMRHRNLVKIITVCSSIDTRGNDFKAIVYDFMPNGSLECWLHPETNGLGLAEERHLNLMDRVTILLDVAYALDHLHCHGPEPVVHCDLKSSNVLLDADMVAHVGDFGLAKILVQESSSLQQSTRSMGFRGTVGYAAPEYGAGNMVSAHGDIYSYGILVLETITGNKPADNRFREGLSLREFVDLALHNRTMDAVDARLSVELENELHTIDGDSSSYKRKTDCVASLLSLGVSCTQELPSSRMSTEGIIKQLLAVKNSLQREHRA